MYGINLCLSLKQNIGNFKEGRGCLLLLIFPPNPSAYGYI